MMKTTQIKVNDKFLVPKGKLCETDGEACDFLKSKTAWCPIFSEELELDKTHYMMPYKKSQACLDAEEK